MKRDISVYLKDILENMLEAEEFVAGFSYEDFTADKKTFNAVIRSLEVIGEAAKHIPGNIRRKSPSVPFKEMAGMRDKIIHSYFGVDREAVWLAVRERIPRLKPLVENILQGLDRDQ